MRSTIFHYFRIVLLIFVSGKVVLTGAKVNFQFDFITGVYIFGKMVNKRKMKHIN